MFVSHARVRIVGLGGRSKKRGPHRRRLAVKEVVRMPCLLPTTVTIVLGLLAVAAGAGMSVIGYVPSHMTKNITRFILVNETLVPSNYSYDTRFYTLKICSYIGPIVMAIGMFAMIVACVFYCEILDKYAILVPDKKGAIIDKKELYQVIVGEMKKSYAQSLITAYSKAAERNLLPENPSSSGDYFPDPVFPLRTIESLTLEQQIDIECEGYTPSPPVPNKSYSVIQARIQRLRSEDNWLKTSSLPNIRRSTSLRRAGRVAPKITDARTLSYDYTMDEARLRRKSMMLRSIVQWNSGSSDLFTQRQRRFSSVKALPSDHRRSFEDLSQPGPGSFPLTRLIQRRGTFACGDMRTRRMKFLLLLEASESQEGFNDPISPEGRPKVTGIRRNSFIPYTTCDKFITGEERKTSRDRRRSSVNPFSFGNRFGNTIPQPGARRHSFFPIRRDDKIYVSDPNQQRRHSFNPTGVSNQLKPEYAGMSDDRRSSINPEGERRSLFVPLQNTRYLQVPGLDPYMEARPSPTKDDVLKSELSLPVSGFNYANPDGAQLLYQNIHDNRLAGRRHSFNPVVRLPSGISGIGEGTQHKVPKITITEDLSPTARYLMVPPQDYYFEERERRHSFKTPKQTKPVLSPAASSKARDKPTPQRISFKLGPNVQSLQLSPPSTQPTKPALKALKPSSEPMNLSIYSHEMVVLEPRARTDSRSASPCSNVSCCGSDRRESEPSVTASRTASISSERSVKTIRTMSPVSVIAADATSYGTFQPTLTSLKTSSFGIQTAGNVAHSPGVSPTMELEISSSNVGPTPYSHFVRKAASMRDRKARHKMEQTDTPGTPNSGPATLFPSAITDANAAIQRSKSASALPPAEVNCSQTIQPISIYANLLQSPSSPSIRHKTKIDQQTDDKS